MIEASSNHDQFMQTMLSGMGMLMHTLSLGVSLPFV